MTSRGDRWWARWHEVDRLFAAALEVPPDERVAFLESVAAGDRELVEAVTELLRAEAASQGFLESAGLAVGPELEGLVDDEPPLERIGRYAILGELGRGGMGSVYLAEHEGDQFRQRVAIKVLRRGLDTDDIVRRFLVERRILASLNHPNVARLHDGGATADGRPYLVMELVEGEAITSYCDRHRLPVRRRLELMLEVSEAVRAAHARLIVHRDLKPSNILVTEDRRVKLLDFGIAKLLDPGEAEGLTRTGSYLLTPDHASPEQLRGEPVTTATDVYQLGVLLFRLLTGHSPVTVGDRSPAGLRELAARLEAPRPSDVVAADRTAAAIAQSRASTPQQLRRELTGELDTIVGKALQPEPQRRYTSVEELAGDLRRFLEGRPISARPDTLLYRSRKFVQRHRWLVPIAAAALLALVAWLATVSRYTAQLERERNLARLEADRAREIHLFLADLFGSADPFAPAIPDLGRRITVAEALDLGVERLRESLADRPVVRASILSTVSDAYADLGVFDRALALRQEALDLQQQTEGPGSREVRDSLGHLATLYTESGELERAGELFEQWLALALEADPGSPQEVAEARFGLARYLISVSRYEQASLQLDEIDRLARSVELRASLLAGTLRARSETLRGLERLEESEQTARRAVAEMDEALGVSSVSSPLARGSRAQTLGMLGRVEEAEELFATALDVLEEKLGADHPYRLSTLSNLAVLRFNAEDYEGAERLLGELVEIGPEVYGELHPTLADHLQNHATVLTRLGRVDEARNAYRRVHSIYDRTLPADNHKRALPLLSLSGLDLAAGEPVAAERSARRALEILRQTLPAEHPITAVTECRVARALAARRRRLEATPFFARASAVLVADTSLPYYRRECLEAAVVHLEQTGASAEGERLEAALGKAEGSFSPTAENR